MAHAPELDVFSCVGTKQEALKNLKEAVRLFLREAEKMGTLEQILEEAGYSKSKRKLTQHLVLSEGRQKSGNRARATATRKPSGY